MSAAQDPDRSGIGMLFSFPFSPCVSNDTVPFYLTDFIIPPSQKRTSVLHALVLYFLQFIPPLVEDGGFLAYIMLKAKLGKCVDWRQIDKKDYLSAMEKSPVNSDEIKMLITNALTEKIDDREIYMKGIDYSYYYETIEE